MRRAYALLILWRDRGRYLPAVFAVAFSCLLITLEVGLLVGTLAKLSVPIDRSRADIWVTATNVPSIDLGFPIPESWLSRAAGFSGVDRVENYVYSVGLWKKPGTGSELVAVIGSRLGDGAVGPISDLTPELRVRLSEPGSIAVDESELSRLGLTRIGDVAEIYGHRVRLAGVLRGYNSPGAAFVFCSLATARRLMPLFWQHPTSTMYLLVRCRQAEDVPAVLARLRAFPNMAAYTRREFSIRTQWYWMTRTNAGVALVCTACLALLVGLVVTSQTLYAAVVSSLREYAVLRALGIARGRMAGLVLAQSFWIGLSGVALGLPGSFALAAAGDRVGATVALPWWLLTASTVVTVGMGLVSGLTALRSLRLVEPITLLR
ncbi:MAG: ABC transporter permease [Gemmataceae bacterium]